MMSTFWDWISSLSWADADVKGIAITVLATLLLILSIKLVARFFRRIRDSYRARIDKDKTAQQLQQKAPEAVTSIQRGIQFTFGLLQFLTVLVIIDIYIAIVLHLFQATRALSEQYFEFVTNPVIALWNASIGYLPNAIEILVISTLTFLGLKVLRIFFRALEAEELKIPGFYADWADPTYKLVRALMLMFLLVAIFPLLPGADDESFKAISIFVGALLSLGSTGAMKNAIAGVVLIYTRAFQIGDWIQVNKSTGEVVRRNLLVTRLRTNRNEQITIPNGEVLKDHVVNFTPAAKLGRLGFTTSVTISYDTDWRTVNELLLKAAASTTALSSDPPPFVFQSGLDDFYARYTLRVYTSGPPPLGKIQTALRQNILDAFHQAGIEIMSPVIEASRSADQPQIPKAPSRSTQVTPAPDSNKQSTD